MTGTYVTDSQGRRVYIPNDTRRIDGLVAEDKVRTLTLFRPGNYAEHPTAPIDIAPRHDLLQGIGTHVKSILQERAARKSGGLTPGSLELASTLEIMRLSGHQRYILLFYEFDGEIDINGQTYKIRRYHTAVEAIFSPATLDAIRGEYTLEHLAWIQRRLDDYEPTAETIKFKQEQFKRYMKQFKRFFGMATPSVKLNISSKTGKTGNKRVQSSMSIPRLQEQLRGEGQYHGRFTQPNYREWYEGETFYGMKLPWFTINTDRIFSTIGDPTTTLDERGVKEMAKRAAQRHKKRIVTRPQSPATSPDDQRYAAETPKKTTLRVFDKGMVAITRQQDGARTISIEAVDAAALQRGHDACKQMGGRWLPLCKRWLGNSEFAQRVVAKLDAVAPGNLPPPEPDHVDPLPPAPAIDVFRPNPKNPKLFYFDVAGAEAAALLMEHGNWVLLPQRKQWVADIFSAACQPYAPQTPWDGDHRGNWTVRQNDRDMWLVRDEPADLIRRVVDVIQRYRY